MEPLTPFIALPNEILAKIMEFLDAGDCKALSLVNKQISPLATRRIGELRYKTLAVQMSRTSLQALIDICSDAILGRCVEEIVLSTRRGLPSVIEKMSNQYQETLNNSGPDLEHARQILLAYIKGYEEEQALESSGEGARMLAAALTSLKQRRQTVQIKATDEDDLDFIGGNEFYKLRLVDWDTDWGTSHLKTSLHIIADAVVSSGCSIDGLDIDHHCHYSNCSLVSDCGIDLNKSVMAVFSNLSKLHLVFSRLPSDQSLAALTRLLLITHQLEDLQLSLGCEDCEVVCSETIVECIDHFLRDIYVWENLRILELSNLPISQHTLIFILRDAVRLKSLCLYGVDLRRGTWIPVALWMREFLNLHQLRLHDVSEIDGADRNGLLPLTLWYHDEISADTIEDVKAALTRYSRGLEPCLSIESFD
jgi:hypothetical protein